MIYLIFTILLIAFIIFSIRFTWWRKSISYDHPRVLMYHMISHHLPKNKSKFNRLRVKPEEFEKQLIWLKKNGFTSFTLNELSKLEKIPSKSVVITFDDGYEDNFTNAFRLLKKYNMKATIFIVLNRFNANWATDKDLNQSSYELNNEKMLSDEQVKTMLQSGLIEIGSHTLNHVNLRALSTAIKQKEISFSKLEIERKFGIVCNTFAYPFGFYDEQSTQIVKSSNYTSATTTINSVYDKNKFNKFEIPRIMISGRQGMFAFILKMKNGRVR